MLNSYFISDVSCISLIGETWANCRFDFVWCLEMRAFAVCPGCTRLNQQMSSACLVPVNQWLQFIRSFTRPYFSYHYIKTLPFSFCCLFNCVLCFKLTADRCSTVDPWFVPIPQPNAAASTSMIGHSENASRRLLDFHWSMVCKSNSALKFHWFTLSDAVLGECGQHERHGVFGMHLGNEKRVQNVSCIPLRLKWAFAFDKTAGLSLFSSGVFQIDSHLQNWWFWFLCFWHV